ncbi:MAG: hypothetical protein ACLU0O_01820 [Collinsella sp.]
MSRTAALTSLIIPLTVAGVPIIDTFSAIAPQAPHISIGQADKGHIHHRLIQGKQPKAGRAVIYAWHHFCRRRRDKSGRGPHARPHLYRARHWFGGLRQASAPV